jgi:hypothetical protein
MSSAPGQRLSYVRSKPQLIYICFVFQIQAKEALTTQARRSLLGNGVKPVLAPRRLDMRKSDACTSIPEDACPCAAIVDYRKCWEPSRRSGRRPTFSLRPQSRSRSRRVAARIASFHTCSNLIRRECVVAGRSVDVPGYLRAANEAVHNRFTVYVRATDGSVGSHICGKC